jgi:hypothetical protein
LNRGNFLELLHQFAETDTELKKHLESSTFTYTSPPIQNEIVHIMSEQVKGRILPPKGAYFSIMLDGTQDIAVHEQESWCVRFADDRLRVHEHFLGFYRTASTTGK